MIEFFECDLCKAKNVAEMFNIQVTDLDRSFLMTENGILGMSVLRLVKSQVEIAFVKLIDGLDFGYYDLLFRSTLNALTAMPNIDVFIGEGVLVKTDYLSQFGFSKYEDKMIINTDKIIFPLCGGDK